MNKAIIAAIAVLVVGGGAYLLLNESDTETDQTDLGLVQDQQQVDLSQVIATVNDQEIKRGALELQMQQASQNPQFSDQNPEEIQGVVLDQLINNKLLIQAARDQDITVEDEVVEEEFNTVMNQFENQEMMDTQLEMLGMDQESLRKEVEDQEILNNYYTHIAEENEVEVTEEEIQTLYDEQIGDQEGAPSLEEASPFISSQLTQQKIQPYLSSILEEYRESADIQIML